MGYRRTFLLNFNALVLACIKAEIRCHAHEYTLYCAESLRPNNIEFVSRFTVNFKVTCNIFKAINKEMATDF